MALLKYLSGNRSDIGSIQISPGNIINCLDTGDIFYDVTDSMRILSSNIEIHSSLDEINNIDKPSTIKIYVDAQKKTFYIYSLSSQDMTNVINQSEVQDIIDKFVNITPATIVKDNVRYAPLTTANNTYLQDGETVETRLNELGIMTSSFANIKAIDTANEFTIPVPFNDYFNYPNGLIVSVGTVYVAPNRYSIDGSKNTITFVDPVQAGRTINFQFFYTTKPGGTALAINNIDGANINRNSIPTDRLAFTSNSYTQNNNSAVATSAGLKNLYDLVVSLCNDSNIIVRCRATLQQGSATNFDLAVPQGYNTLVDGDILNIKFMNDVPQNASIVFNRDSYPIYEDSETPINAGEIYTGDELVLQYNSDDSRFYITNGMAYRTDQYTYNIVVNTETDTFSYAESGFLVGYDNLNVFHNGLRLIKNINYTIDYNSNTITLKDYTAKVGDTIEFVVDRVNRTRATRKAASIDFLNQDELLKICKDLINKYTTESDVKLSDMNTEIQNFSNSFEDFKNKISQQLSEILVDNCIHTNMIADGAVTSDKIQDLTILGRDIANSAISNDKLADLTITGSKIQAATITSDKLANGAVQKQNIDMTTFDLFYPVGSIYMNVNNVDPKTLFGFGTWEKMPAGRMLIGDGAADYGVTLNTGDKAGEAVHALTIDEMPAHNHSGVTSTNGDHHHGSWGESSNISWDYGIYDTHNYNAHGSGAWDSNNVILNTSTNGNHNHSFTTDWKGTGAQHNNMSPYVVVNIWHRTA